MKVAWVTHREWGQSGGAEAADFDMVSRRPDGVDVTLIRPGGVGSNIVDEFDKVVISGLYGFSSRELNDLARADATWWVHDTQFSGHWLNAEVKRLICLTPPHVEFELESLPTIELDRVLVNPGWMNTASMRPIPYAPRFAFALWAHRPEYHKGLDLAAEWAVQHNVPLEVMVAKPHQLVIEKMKKAKYFILLSHIFDPGPRAIMEAQLCGCEIIVNDEVGWFDEPPEDLSTRLSNADKAFWQAVLDDA